MKKRMLIFFFLAFNLLFCFSNEQIDEDLNYLKSLITECYSVYDDIEDKDFTIDGCMSEIKALYLESCSGETGDEEKNSDLLASCIFSVLDKEIGIRNNHFIVQSSLNTYYQTPVKWFYSNLIFEKKDNVFQVYESKDKNIKKGDLFTDDAGKLYPFIHDGKELYRYGMMSAEFLEETTISVNNSLYDISINFDYILDSKQEPLNYFETDDSIYISIGDCNFNLSDEKLHRENIDYFNTILSSLKSSETQNIIIDLRSNRGGMISNVEGIVPAIYCKYDNNLNRKYNTIKQNAVKFSKTLVSPLFAETYLDYVKGNKGFSALDLDFAEEQYEKQLENPCRYYVTDSTGEPELKTLANKGNQKIIILINKHTGSAAEELLSYFGFIENNNVVVLGTNSMGALDYPGDFVYELPDSKVKLYLSAGTNKNLPNLKFNSAWHGDGCGFYPTYWTISGDLSDTIFYFTSDSRMKKKLKGIGKRIL